jgi:cyclopropane-fatty-acyl-phospholipid synthase
MAISSVLETLWQPFVFRSFKEELAEYTGKPFEVRLWNGASWGMTGYRAFTLVVNNADGLRRLFVDPTELGLGEAYLAGDFDVEGDLEAAFELGDYLLGRSKQSKTSGPLNLLDKISFQEEPIAGSERAQLHGPIHSKSRDVQAIRYHYDLPPEFFELWLDPRMLYSCAYFANGDDSDLDAGQDSKLEYIAKKLRLQPGEHLLDIGCGWGGLIVYAAAQYGVKAHGVTLSLRQAEVARKRIHDAGLDGQCRVDVCDYRDIESAQQFDKIVSIGMFEHVGEAQLPEYFHQVWRLLRAGGAFLNSGISSSVAYSQRRGPSFIDKYVFPDGELVPISKSLSVAEATGLEVRDVESLREHYALTLRQWVRRLEACSEKAREITDETTYRIWRLYMAGSEHWFRTGALNLYQMLLVKPRNGESGMPLTRAEWYGGKNGTNGRPSSMTRQ